jgi:dTMP kinase
MSALISFCGLDGSGKTTQIELLARALTESGLPTMVLKQPTPWYRSHEKVRLRIEHSDRTVDLRFLSLFSAADRLQQQVDVVEPALAAGNGVIMDRYVYSGIAYMLARGLNDIEWLEEINKFATRPTVPIYLRIDPALALRRVVERDGFSAKKEEQDIELMTSVSSAFDVVAERHGLLVLDATQPSHVIHDVVIHALTSKCVGLLRPR